MNKSNVFKAISIAVLSGIIGTSVYQQYVDAETPTESYTETVVNDLPTPAQKNEIAKIQAKKQREAKKAEEAKKAAASNKHADDKNGTQKYDILAVTACPTGIAHTYMAAEALENKAVQAMASWVRSQVSVDRSPIPLY